MIKHVGPNVLTLNFRIHWREPGSNYCLDRKESFEHELGGSIRKLESRSPNSRF